jgi:amino acid efflux transporter
VVVCFLTFSAVGVISGTGLVSLGALLAVAGKNFYLIYLLSVVAYLRLFPKRWERIFGSVVLLVLLGVTFTFGIWQIVYAAVLFGAGTWLVHWRGSRRSRLAPTESPEIGAVADLGDTGEPVRTDAG